MKKIILLILFFTASANAQQPSADVLAAIDQQNRSYEQGYRERNIEMVVAVHTEDAIVMPPNRAPLVGHAGIREMLIGDMTLGDYALGLFTTELEQYGDLVIETGGYKANIVMGDGTVIDDEGNTLIIWKRQSDGRWLMDRDIFNSTVPLE